MTLMMIPLDGKENCHVIFRGVVKKEHLLSCYLFLKLAHS